MALFHRRSQKDAEAAPTPVPAEPAEVTEPTEPEPAPAEPVPQVPISVSTYGKPAPAARAPRPQAAPPAPTEAVAGMPDNVVLKAALEALPDKPDNLDILGIMRQALQGRLYVRAQGNAQELLDSGQPLSLAVSTVGEQRFLLAFSGGAALRASIAADGQTATSAVGQPAAAVLQNVLTGGYDGLILDHAVPRARAVLPKALIEKSFEKVGTDFTIKNLLSQPRTEDSADQVADAVTRVGLWVAANSAGENGAIGLAEARTADGARRLEVYSHPLEVLAMRRDDRPLPLTPEQLGKTLAADPALTGIVIDAAGPWIILDREQLAASIALA